MKDIGRVLGLFVVFFSLIVNTLPCGPSSVTPIFEYENAPENPYENFANGNLGIIKPGFHRSVLYAAYRYINGGGFTTDDQKALVDVWQAEFDNKDYQNEDITDAVRTWVEKRQEIVGKDEKTPDIYTERNYAGYDFFPNCTRNAFETATETLADRASAHGPSDAGVLGWVKGQDEVFTNCSTGKQSPDVAPPGSPDWLQKDRAYQIAAASFYSLDYEDAKRRFLDIAQDTDSPWQETASYLVARTLIRQASLTKDADKAAAYYSEAEQRLENFQSGKFADSAERMIGLIKYRLRPKERVGELARKLMIQGGNTNFRQDVIDYTWLTDKFESEVLTAEEKRKEDEAKQEEAKNAASSNQMTGADYANRLGQSSNTMNAAANAMNAAANTTASEYKFHNGARKVNDDDIEINVYSDDGKENWSYYVRANVTDDEAIAEGEKISNQPFPDSIKTRIREARRNGYSQRFSNGQQSGHQVYYGSEKMTLSLLPDYLRSDELTEWIYLYPIQDNEAYLYSLSKFRSVGSDLWLMTALSKADKNSTQLMRLLDAADKTSHMSPAYQTIAYHHARLLLDLGKVTEARKLIDEILRGSDPLTISARNQFMALRLKLAESLPDFLTYSLRKPFAFDFDGETGTIQEFIDAEKKWYDPKNNDNKTEEQYDQEVEDRFKNEIQWQDRQMFDSDTITILNDHFPLSALMEVESSPAIPDYMRDRLAIPIWTRAVLFGDYVTAAKIAPEMVKYHPEFAELMARITAAKTPAAQQNAILFFMLKNPILSPDVEDGMGKSDNEFGEFDANDWWCAAYEDESADNSSAPKTSPRPAFLTAAQEQAVKTEHAKLKAIGDAPKFLADKVMAWAKRSPLDRRIPESLYIVYEANGWTKYGCGSNTELHDEIGAYLKLHYPQSEWTKKMIADEKSDQ